MPSNEFGLATIGRKMVKGGFILILLRLSIRLIGLVSTMILFRILAPDDFGLVALAMVVVGFAEVVAEFGFEQTLLRNKHAERSDYDVAWTLTFLRGIVVATILLLIADPAAQYLNEPRLRQIVYWLAVIPLLDGSTNIGIIDFSKNLQFGKDYVLRVSIKVFSFCFTLYFAYTLRNYWALVIGILSGKCVGLFLGYLFHPYRPRFSLKGARAVFGFSIWIFLNHLVLYGGNQADKIMIQKFYDAHMVGIFRVAEEICSIVMELVWPVERALYAGYAQLADDFDALRRTVLNSTGLVAMIGVPMSIGILLVAEPAVAILLGDKGIPAVPFVQVLVLHGAIRSCSTGAMPAFMVLNKPHINTQFTLVAVTIRLSILFACFPFMGVMVAPWSLVAGSFFSFLAVWIQLKRHLNLRWLDYPAALWRTFAATCGMAAAVQAINLIPAARKILLSDWQNLSIKGTIGALVYVSLVMILWALSGRPTGPESQILKLVQSIIARWRTSV
ncbi:MAG: lipopolysaccharide biosynthesis protein [Propionivibrio sp.]|nr:lipopolysaccharide biosynthesis protein [Propionivibrio sp.]